MIMKKVKISSDRLAWCDECGNMWSVEHFTEQQAAVASLTLKECYDCIDCVECFGCVDCEACIRCIDCIDCFGCQHCIDCEDLYQLTGYADNIKAPYDIQADINARFGAENPVDYIATEADKHNAELIRVGFCATEQDYRLVYPDETADYDTWREHVYATLEALQERGLNVELCPIEPNKYFAWLNGRLNTQKARVYFVNGLSPEDLENE